MKTKTIVAALCVTLGVAGCSMLAKEDAAPVSGTVSEGVVEVTAEVVAIDHSTRKVTLERPDGSLVKFVAGPEVRNLAQVKKGDEVKVSYYESLAYEVKKPGEAVVGAAVAEGTERAEVGEKPGAAAVTAVSVTATIAAIDKAAKTVTLRAPDGELTTVKVRYPEKLERVSVGDLVEITYTEALAISVDTPE